MIRYYFSALGSVFSEFRKFLKTNFRNKKIILWFSKGREMEKGVRIKWEWGEREWFGEKKTTRPRPVTASVSKHFITNISWRTPLYFFLSSLFTFCSQDYFHYELGNFVSFWIETASMEFQNYENISVWKYTCRTYGWENGFVGFWEMAFFRAIRNVHFCLQQTVKN